MSADLSEFCRQVLDHDRRARNRVKLATANRVAHGDNPRLSERLAINPIEHCESR